MVLDLFRPLDPYQGHHHQRPDQTPQAIPAIFQPAIHGSCFFQQVRLFEQRQAQQRTRVRHAVGGLKFNGCLFDQPERRKRAVQRRGVRDAGRFDDLWFDGLWLAGL